VRGELVIAGKMSANAAAIEAGWRKKLTSVERVLKLLPELTRLQLRSGQGVRC
jgi:hypothetical protein